MNRYPNNQKLPAVTTLQEVLLCAMLYIRLFKAFATKYEMLGWLMNVQVIDGQAEKNMRGCVTLVWYNCTIYYIGGYYVHL